MALLLRVSTAVLLAVSSLVLSYSTIGASYEIPRATPEEVGMNADLLGRLEPALNKLTAERKVPGTITMVARHGKMVADIKSGYDRDDYIFRLFSQSKPVTAVATLILIDDGLIGLDDPIVKYIPEFRALRVIINATMGAPIETVPLKRNITVRHLLTHTSGLCYGDGGDTMVDEMYKAAKVLDLWHQDLDGLVDKLGRLPLVTQPGTEWRYSLGFDVLGCLIQRLTGIPYDQFLQTRLFGPLDMKDTGFYVPPEKLHRLVVYWTSAAAPGVLVPLPMSYTGTDFTKRTKLISGGGGLASTARDYFRFAQMILNGGELGGVRILKQETAKAMITNQIPASMKPMFMGVVTFKTSDFGYGVAIQNRYLPALAPVGEAGWGGAASTNWWICPDTNTTIVSLTQVAPFTNSLAETIRPIVYTSLKNWDPKVPVIVGPSAAEAAKNGLGRVSEQEVSPLGDITAGRRR